MQPESETQAGILKAYNAYWANYLSGNVPAMEALLTDDYTQVGSAASEVFFNKQDAVKFLHDTIHEVAGRAEMRNQTIKLEQVGELFLVHDLFDAYVLDEGNWIFYAKFRASTLMKEVNGGWKFIHQHSSIPDMRTQDGENLAIDKVAAENVLLKDAIKRRTIELEQKNHELVLEASLERVRTVVMGMNKQDDLMDVCEVLYTELTSLGFTELRNTMVNILNDEKGSFLDYDYSENAGKTLTLIPYNFHPLVEKQVRFSRNPGDAFFQFSFTGDELREFRELRKRNGELDDPRLDVSDSLNYHFYSIDDGSIGISTYAPISPEQSEVIKRFRNVFDFAYRRYTDVAKAEAQAREAQIEVALERIRARAMAMHTSAELVEVANILREQMGLLGQSELETCVVNLHADDSEFIQGWSAYREPGSTENITNGTAIFRKDSCELLRELMAIVKLGKDEFTIEASGEKLKEFLNVLLAADANIPKDIATKLPPKVYYHFAVFTDGSLLSVSYQPPTEETRQLQKRAAAVFDLAYRRYRDLKNAEAQAKEAQIQLALERVRAKTMAMQRSEDLFDVIHEVKAQMQELNFRFDSADFMTDYSDKGYKIWLASDKQSFSHPLYITNNDTKMSLVLKEAMERGDNFFPITLNRDEKNEHFAHVFKNSMTANVAEETKQYVLAAPGMAISCFSVKDIILSICNFSGIPYTDPENDIIKRFGSVFEQSYTRFLDLQKAEAQAREAEIELALERVRARTMAMQKSEELKDAIKVVYQQLVHLNIKLDHAGFVVNYQPKADWHFWIADERDIPSTITHPYFESVWATQFNEAKEKDEDCFVTNLNFEEKNKFYRELLSYVPGLADAAKDFYLTCPGLAATTVLFEDVSLYIENFSGIPYSDDENKILMRFGKVFQQTYTRFLDLQKAEAQAREAEIELALERVRARTMAMQKSDELPDASHLVFQQFESLGETAEHFSIGIINEEEEVGEMYATIHGDKLLHKRRISIHEPIAFKKVYTAWKEKGHELRLEITGKELEAYNIYRNKIIGRKIFAEKVKTGDKWIILCAFFSRGLLSFASSAEPSGEILELLKRFTKVFDGTYTRFLDLQKAEAQAREAQIQLALERVRARTMAMQKSDELPDAANLLFQQVQSLGMPAWSAGYCIWDNDEKDLVTLWMSSEGVLQPPFKVPTTEDELCIEMRKGSEQGNSLHVVEMGGEKLVAHYNYMRTLPGVGKVLDSIIEAGHALPTFQIMHQAYFSKGFLLFITYEPVPESHDIFKRFSNVFEQTYTRFLDLQKAEAQARESQIQLALERARAQSMMMQHSTELDDTLRVFHEQVLLLGIPSAFSFLWLPNEENDRHIFWAAWAENSSTVFNSKAINYPLDRNEPATAQCLVDWKGDQPVVAYHVPPNGVKSYFAAWSELIAGVDQLKPEYFIDGLYYVEAFMKYGCFGVMVKNSLSEEENKILDRFAVEFERAYTRFLDLQNAEAQAKESQVQLALERVRARTMAMQRSDELMETAVVLFNQLKQLGEHIERTIIGVINEEEGFVDFWATRSDGSQMDKMQKFPLDEPIVGQKVFDGWRQQKKSIVIDLRGQDLEKYFEFLKTRSPQLKRESFGDRRVENFAFFSKGFLGIISADPAITANTGLYERFAVVFNQTYTRFLDLQKAEAQAREAQIETALEKVRSRTLAMQRSDELAETASELFRQMIGLGIEPNRLYITIIDEEKDEADFWITDEDGSKLAAAYTASLNDNSTFRTMYDGWKQNLKHLVIDMHGEELRNYFEYLQRIHVPFKGGLEQQRRVQHIAYFSKGFIGMASPDEQPAESLTVLERFAYVFNLTYTRFSDLQLAEAHALQAERDLVEIKAARKKAEDALIELQATQKQLIQSEKMASLGELTAGIAHEIQNPLNFVNNFSEVNDELLSELVEEVDKGNTEEVRAIATDIKLNLEKISHHGKRADAIVKGMLQHSRSSSGIKEPVDVNVLCDEYLRLAYHGMRAKDKLFNATMKTDYDKTIGMVNIIPQDIGRVILNMINNAFYAVTEKRKQHGDSYDPTVSVSTKKTRTGIEVQISDNGDGVPHEVLNKIFQPFFTTKPTGEGTGLGLSLSYDIVKAHGGEIQVDTKEGERTSFIIQLNC